MQLLELITIGLPFCGFKLLGAVPLFASEFRPFGFVLLAWGLIDLAINLANLGSVLVRRKRLTEACLITLVLKHVRASQFSNHAQDLGNSIDVLLSFAIVAIMVGGGWIPELAELGPPALLPLWNGCVILNVLGAGIARVSGAVGRHV